MPNNQEFHSDQPSTDRETPNEDASASSDSSATERDSLFNSWQKVLIGQAVTALSIAVIFVLTIMALWGMKRVLGFVQPVVVPLVVAAILAFLLDPLIVKLQKRGVGKKTSLAIVLAGFFGFVILLLGTVIPIATIQANSFIKNWPETYDKSRTFFNEQLIPVADRLGVDLGMDNIQDLEQTVSDSDTTTTEQIIQETILDQPDSADSASADKQQTDPDSTEPEPEPEPDALAAASTEAEGTEAETSNAVSETAFDQLISSAVSKLVTEENQVKIFYWLQDSLQGVLGAAGYILGFLLVPVYLFYFLKERNWIKDNWQTLLPMRKGAFRDEIADTLKEINGYLVAFFRGQVLVSFIDGTLTAIALHIIGLPYAFIIGFSLAVIGIIPFIGIIVTMIPAVIVAFASASTHDWTWVQHSPAGYALLVVGIFMLIQQFDGLIIQPKIVGDSTGLHPMTVIFSVVFWSFVFGGILGAILGVPLTAALKVLLKRYVWESSIGSRLRDRSSSKSASLGKH